MDFNIKEKKIMQHLALFMSVIVLFSIFFQDTKLKQSKRINDISGVNIVNEASVSPKALFLESWQIIKTNYYQQDLNRQNWHRWKKRYFHKIKTNEDAYVAINSMLASLDDSYSKFMSEDEFAAQNNALNSKLYGIGINIASASGKIYIANVIEGAPAHS